MSTSYRTPQEGVKPRVAQFYEYLVRLSARHGYCDQPYAHLADVQGKTVGTVRQWVDLLAAAGWLAVEHLPNGRRNLIPLVPPPSAAEKVRRPSSYALAQAKRALIERDGNYCAYCWAEGVPLQVDHIIPFSDLPWNDLPNYALACHECNLLKRNRAPADWIVQTCDRIYVSHYPLTDAEGDAFSKCIDAFDASMEGAGRVLCALMEIALFERGTWPGLTRVAEIAQTTEKIVCDAISSSPFCGRDIQPYREGNCANILIRTDPRRGSFSRKTQALSVVSTGDTF